MAALLDTRDKVKALEAELQTLRAQKSAPRTGPTVNPDEDPRGAWEEAQALRRQTELDWSRKYAVKEHGEDVVTAAHDWAFARLGPTGEGDPAFDAKIRASQDPYSLVLAEYRQHQLLEKLQDPAKRDRLLALLSDEATPTASPQGQAPATPAASPQPASVAPPVSSPLPPKSIASAPAAASAEVVPVGPGQAFDNAFR